MTNFKDKIEVKENTVIEITEKEIFYGDYLKEKYFALQELNRMKNDLQDKINDLEETINLVISENKKIKDEKK